MHVHSKTPFQLLCLSVKSISQSINIIINQSIKTCVTCENKETEYQYAAVQKYKATNKNVA